MSKRSLLEKIGVVDSSPAASPQGTRYGQKLRRKADSIERLPADLKKATDAFCAAANNGDFATAEKHEAERKRLQGLIDNLDGTPAQVAAKLRRKADNVDSRDNNNTTPASHGLFGGSSATDVKVALGLCEQPKPSNSVIRTADGKFGPGAPKYYRDKKAS